MSKHRPQDNPEWLKIAPTADKKAWAKEYNRLFKANLKVQPSWQRAQKTHEIEANASQTEAFNLIKSLVPAGATVLDVGSGPGFLTHALLSAGYKAIGCDVAEEAVKFAKSIDPGYNNKFFVKSAEEVHKLNKKFDIVVCNQVLEHLQDPEKVIEGLWGLVADGGHLVIGVPKGREFDIAYHLSFYDTEADYMKLLRAATQDDGKKYPSQFKTFTINNTNISFFLGALKKEPILLKYALIVGIDGEASAANDVIFDTQRLKTGVFNWGKMFNGCAHTLQTLGDPNEYDVLHVQISGTNFHVPRALRNQLGPDSKTKLVVCLDYAPEYWYMYPPFPDILLDALGCADYIVSVEPTSARLISQLLDGAQVHVIPHPTNIMGIAGASVPKAQRKKEAFVMTHRDEADTLPYFILRGSGLDTSMYGRVGPLVSPNGAEVGYQGLFYNRVSNGYMGNQTLIREHMAYAYLAIDSYTHHVCGRTAIEFAALGVPCIGFENVWAQGHCFPDLTVPTGRADLARELVQRLIEDEDFYNEVSQKAQKQAAYFGWDVARERFLEMLGVDDAKTMANERPKTSEVGEATPTVRPLAASKMEQPYEQMDRDSVAAG